MANEKWFLGLFLQKKT